MLRHYASCRFFPVLRGLFLTPAFGTRIRSREGGRGDASSLENDARGRLAMKKKGKKDEKAPKKGK